jgi:hypothetical protein
MTKLVKLWRTLETLPNLSATRAEWKLKTGEGYAIVEGLLKPTGRNADVIPCSNERLGMHYHSVVEYEDGSAQAVFIDEFQDCPSFPVEPHERAIVTPDMAGLCGRICLWLGLDSKIQALSLPLGIYAIGCYYPLEAFRFPVFLALKPTVFEIESALHAVAALQDDPFIFLTATSARLSDRALTLISSRNVLVRALSDCLLVSEGRMIAANSWNADILAFADKIVPKPEPVKAFFPTPPRTTWADVTIRFVDGHTVFVNAAGVTQRLSYTEMGMANRRESKPSKQWEFLYEIAENHGAIDFDMGNARKNKSWKYELSSDLRGFFRIDDDPFIYDESTGHWQAKFTLIPIQGD